MTQHDQEVRTKDVRNSIVRQVKRWNGESLEHNRKPRPQVLSERVDASRRTAKVVSTNPSAFVEPAREIPIAYDCDILVVGGGPGGLSAALSAKRADPTLEVCLMDLAPYFGGTITKTGMETMGWYRYEGTVESDGIGREMERVAEQMGGTADWPFNSSQCLNAHHFKIVSDRLVKDAGITPILHSLAVEAVVEDNTIKGVVFESESGRQAVRAKVVIDGTGNATIAHLAGAPFRKTRKEEMMGVTTVFSVIGVDKQKFLDHIKENSATYADWNSASWQQETTGKEESLLSPYWGKEFEKAKKLGIIPEDADVGGSWSAISDHGEATNLNLVHMSNIDCTDQRDLTVAEIHGRETVMHAIKALRALVPGFENVDLCSFSSYLGVRDSRYIDSGHTLDGIHVSHEGRSDRSIGVFPEFVDGRNILILPSTGRVFDVPYDILVPKRIDNLLAAGRHVDVDHLAMCAMRNMMACTVTGQGAGVAAAVAIRSNTTVRDVRIQDVQQALRAQGVSIHKEEIPGVKSKL